MDRGRRHEADWKYEKQHSEIPFRFDRQATWKLISADKIRNFKVGKLSQRKERRETVGLLIDIPPRLFGSTCTVKLYDRYSTVSKSPDNVLPYLPR
jgi:hypothetical protein